METINNNENTQQTIPGTEEAQPKKNTPAPAPEMVMDPTPISAVLKAIHGGKFHYEISEAYQELIQEVMKTGLSGKFTITLTVKREPKWNAILTNGSYDRKLPRVPAPDQIMFPDHLGRLYRDDPGQAHLFNKDARPIFDNSPTE